MVGQRGGVRQPKEDLLGVRQRGELQRSDGETSRSCARLCALLVELFLGNWLHRFLVVVIRGGVNMVEVLRYSQR